MILNDLFEVIYPLILVTTQVGLPYSYYDETIAA